MTCMKCGHVWSNMARAGMNPKTLQYLMGHSEIGVTMNVYTHLGLEHAQSEIHRLEEAEAARLEQERVDDCNTLNPQLCWGEWNEQ